MYYIVSQKGDDQPRLEQVVDTPERALALLRAYEDFYTRAEPIYQRGYSCPAIAVWCETPLGEELKERDLKFRIKM